MLIINSEEQEPKQSIYFRSDPLVELVASLHVIGDPEHHEHCESWAMKAISHIGKTLRSEIVYFATNYSQWLFIMDIVTGIACDNWKNEDGHISDIKESLKKFGEISDFDFAYMFLGLSAFHIEKTILEKWIASPDAISTAELAPVTVFISENNIKVFLKNIQTYKNRLIRIFEEYWKKVFETEWETIKRHLSNTIEEQKKVASKTNTLEYILKLHSGMEIINHKLRMKKEVNYEMNLEDISSVHIFPSVFTGPHLMMDIRNSELVLYYNLDFYSITMAKDIPEDIMDTMQVLGDKSRVKILKILWQGSATTQSISQILKLAPSTISVHLKLLKRANLVKSEQVKKFVYYEVNKELLEEIWTKFNQYLND